ncbi:FSR family fosmidomycin resistance protein-like MFS transporter [Roseinatronobacter thiooxidans]|uniref:FSR family fosmidomycin resistance protein-like MFS transporter n=1 Tax=Roseinatronobacter thiooxidans TaxID=121821 RepID=A0A2W7QBZ9_9RHOB|nr:MFS transporter [Roseinatronobacter thiooxidans]PZX46134.1 FSR family fosmidomycin resistance protein-like MFS transporter [Roseinatronobacter thiooxidans]
MSLTAQTPTAERTTWLVLLAISLCHMINDIMQSLLAAIYPLLALEFDLSFWQIGMMTFAFQVTASLLQPLVGLVTDRRPMPQSLPIGMGSTLCGLILLAYADSYGGLLTGAMLIGIGSAVFHPESSRIARLASGGKFGTAQSLFQVGGNFGAALGPLLAAFIVVPLGRPSVAAFAIMALVGMVILNRVGLWYGTLTRASAGKGRLTQTHGLARNRVIWAIVVLAILTFSKNAYTASISSYYTFFLIERFDLGIVPAQQMLFLFLAASAAGVMLGGLIGDRFGPLVVIWASILGVLPFTLMLPYVGLGATAVLSVIIGVIIASAFPAIVVYAQTLLPGRVGLVAGIFFGFAFGMGGIAAAVLGVLADSRGIAWVYQACAFLPLLGLFTIFLPRQSALGS